MKLIDKEYKLQILHLLYSQNNKKIQQQPHHI